MIKIIKMVVLALFLVIMAYYTFQYLAKGRKALSFLSRFTEKTFEKGIEKSLDLVGVGGEAIQKIGSKITPATPARPSTLAVPVNTGQAVPQTPPIQADSSPDSSIQRGAQKGYCYIGNDRGIRSCLYVNDPAACMSGEIFSTKSVCVNPTLRPGVAPSARWYTFQNGAYQLNQLPSTNSQHSPTTIGPNAGDFNFNKYYDMRGEGAYMGNFRPNNRNYYNNTINTNAQKTQTISQYNAQLDRNARYGGRGQSMSSPVSGSSSMLYTS